MKPGKTGIRRLMDAMGYSMKGLRSAFKHESAFRQELLLFVILFPLSFVVAEGLTQWMMLVAPLFLLLIIELLNSAIEAVVDRIGDEHHELSGRAKDMGSAAVFICLVLIAGFWGSTAWQNLL